MLSGDNELVARCQRGDQAAYGELVRRHRKPVYEVAYALLGDHDQAEDIVQEALLRAYKALSKFDQRQSFAPWIKRIAVNCALSALHKQQNRDEVRESVPASRSGDEPAEHTVATEMQAKLQEALAILPAQQRAAISLFALNDMDLTSTAAAMGCAVGTVKTHLHRARQKLRQMLADYLEEN